MINAFDFAFKTGCDKVASRREPPWRVQVDHPASRIIGDMNERTTQSRVRNNSHFAHAAFVATFEPKDIGHALSGCGRIKRERKVKW
jgi:hypothetical protein